MIPFNYSVMSAIQFFFLGTLLEPLGCYYLGTPKCVILFVFIKGKHVILFFFVLFHLKHLE
jgi:hypothetical protein